MVSRVLLVDDDPISLLMAKEIIQNESFSNDVTITMNGFHAIREIEFLLETKKMNAETQIPHLIFLDLEMPEMSGWEFLEHYTKYYQEKLPDTNIVILSSAISDCHYEEVKKYPAVTRLVKKPLQSEQIESLKRNHNLKKYFS